MDKQNFSMFEDVPDYESIINSNEKFTDTQFPPTFESIYSSNYTNFVWNESEFHYTKTQEEFENTVGWIRLSHLFSFKNLRIFSSNF